jgi:hypothetical protein
VELASLIFVALPVQSCCLKHSLRRGCSGDTMRPHARGITETETGRSIHHATAFGNVGRSCKQSSSAARESYFRLDTDLPVQAGEAEAYLFTIKPHAGGECLRTYSDGRLRLRFSRCIWNAAYCTHTISHSDSSRHKFHAATVPHLVFKVVKSVPTQCALRSYFVSLTTHLVCQQMDI